MTVTDLIGDVNPPFDDYIAQVLTDLGYHVTVNRLPLTDANIAHFYDPAGGVQVGSGRLAPRLSTPVHVLRPALPMSHRPEQQQYAFNYCDRERDRAADAALALEATDPGRANRAWADVQHRVVDGAPVVFGATTRDVWYTLASGRQLPTGRDLRPTVQPDLGPVTRRALAEVGTNGGDEGGRARASTRLPRGLT